MILFDLVFGEKSSNYKVHASIMYPGNHVQKNGELLVDCLHGKSSIHSILFPRFESRYLGFRNPRGVARGEATSRKAEEYNHGTFGRRGRKKQDKCCEQTGKQKVFLKHLKRDNRACSSWARLSFQGRY